MRAAIYARRSTDHQEASIDTQMEEGRRYIEANGWTLVATFIDDSLSRAEYKKRPALFRMIRGAEAGDFDVLVMRDVDRLGGDINRNGVILSELIDRGIRIEEYLSKNTVKLDNAMSKFLAGAKNFAAELEREKTSARTFEALKVKARNGRNVGGRCYGYDNVRSEDGTDYRINEEQAEIVRSIFTKYAEGSGLKRIARELTQMRVPPPQAGRRGTGSWSASAIHPMLRRKRYRGDIVWGEKEKQYKLATKVRLLRQPDDEDIVRSHDERLRIVSEELWMAVQARIARAADARAVDPKSQRKGPPAKYVLTGMAECAVCSGRMTVTAGKMGKQPVKVLVCAYHRERGEAVCPNSLRRPLSEIEGSLAEWFQSKISEERFTLALLQEVRRRVVARAGASESGEVPKLEAEAKQLRLELTSLAQAIAVSTGTIPALVKEMEARQIRLQALDARIAILRGAPTTLSLEVRRLEREVKKRLGDLKELFARNPEGARQFYQAVLDGKLRFDPIELPEGKRYRITGRAKLGGYLQLPPDPDAPVTECLRPQRESNPR
jgi:site-specific DNA recombinase